MTHNANAAAIRAEIAQIILSSEAAPYVRGYYKNYLDRYIEEPAALVPSRYDLIQTTFDCSDGDAKSSLELTVELINDVELPFEADEDSFNASEINISVQWPGHGNRNLAVAIKMIEFYRQIITLAEEIKEKFAGTKVVRLNSTAAQRKEWEERRAAEKLQTETHQWAQLQVATVSRRMQLSSKRIVEGAIVPDYIAVGFTKEIKGDNGKLYNVTVFAKNHVVVERTR